MDGVYKSGVLGDEARRASDLGRLGGGSERQCGECEYCFCHACPPFLIPLCPVRLAAWRCCSLCDGGIEMPIDEPSDECH